MKTVLFFKPQRRLRFRDQLEGIYRSSRRFDWHVQMMETSMSQDHLREALEFWRPIGAFVEYGDAADAIDTRILGGLPVVFFDIGRRAPGHGVYVRLDSAAAGRIGAEHLLGLRLQHYAYVGFRETVPWDRRRRNMFVQTVRRAGCPVSVFNCPHPKAVRHQELVGWLRNLKLPCGILAANDIVGEEVLNAATGIGISVPDELAVMGVDNNRQLCENQMPSLTSINTDVSRGGSLSVGALQHLIASGESWRSVRRLIEFPPACVVMRVSTRRIPFDPSKVRAALESIRRHACEGISVSDVVAEMGLSRRAAEKHFRLATGQSIHGEIDKVRFASVFDCLRNPRQSIEAIADICGFSSRSALRKAFHIRTGLSMRQWRTRELGSQK